MDEIAELQSELMKKTQDINNALKEKKIQEFETEREMLKIYNTVNQLKEIIMKTDYEKKKIKKEISEVYEYIRKYGKSEMFLMEVEGEMKKKTEESEEELQELANRKKMLQEGLNRIRREIEDLKGEVVGAAQGVSELKEQKKGLKEKAEVFRNTSSARYLWLSTRRTRRKSEIYTRYSSCKVYESIHQM